MLSSNTAVATIAVKNLNNADKFYGDVLGFDRTEICGDEVAAYESGDGALFIYESEHAGTCKATVATWPVFHIEDVVEELKEKGIRFERYDDMPGANRTGDIYESDGVKAAWFKDPDGNTLCLVEDKYVS